MRLEIAKLVLVLGHLAPTHGKSMWSSTPASYGTMGRDDYLLKTGYPVGNGKLGAIPFGSPGREKVNLNIDSLWSGGPFEVDNYRGGNPSRPLYDALPEIRSTIFENGTGNIGALLGNRNYYGSNRVLGNLTVSYDGVDDFTGYRRELDLTEGVHTTRFIAGAGGADDFTTAVFCSYPDQVCVYHIETNGALPTIRVGLENLLVNSTLYKDSCEPGKGAVYHSGVTQLGPPEGMKYTAAARVNTGTATTTCSGNTLVIDAKRSKEVTIVIAAETNYNQKAGNEEAGWTFKGEDPYARVEETSSSAAGKSYKKLLQAHLADYRALSGAFTLELTDKNESKDQETAALIRAYTYDTEGDPFVDSLLFDYARHLLISSSRDNSLPANLQGRWTELLKPSWGADYHSNINIQMNYWVADQTGLAATQNALWNYIEDTWVPRGSQTAELLYGATGWVTHNEMNIFGFTAMKDQASWANYAISGAWMMQHVWDSFDYTRDIAWLETQGYPLIKGTAEFWLSTLQEDLFFEDGSLVVNPCNSAEHGPTTFGCVHFQQLIHQVFDAALAAQGYLTTPDTSFADRIVASLERLDTGLHFSTWGGIKEWKLPDSYGFDNKTTHRHLSHLNGWFPGYSIASFANGYTNTTIQNAVRETLISRGMGNAADANAGWAKVWRSACWARLNETQKAYDHLRYAVDENFAPNGMSMYSGSKPPFQIDANFGYAGAMLAMLVVDMPLSHDRVNQERVVVLGPAIPKRWGAGIVRGLRLRGGAKIDFSWAEGGVVRTVKIIEPGVDKIDIVNVGGKRLARIKG